MQQEMQSQPSDRRNAHTRLSSALLAVGGAVGMVGGVLALFDQGSGGGMVSANNAPTELRSGR